MAFTIWNMKGKNGVLLSLCECDCSSLVSL
uniref:Uncharacterized protein n=1 Tax=Arundo donax TaxID=35708 RepID=A0A0A9U9J5_ARUDO